MKCKLIEFLDKSTVILLQTYYNYNKREKKIDDIAIDNSIPVSSVKNWLRKGKVELQNIIKNKYPDLYDMYMEFGCAV